MVRKLAAAGLVASALFVVSGPSRAAGEFPATPVQHGAPLDLPAEQSVPGADLAIGSIDAATKSLLEPILALGEPGAATAKHSSSRHHAAHAHHARHGQKAASRGKAAIHSAKIAGHRRQASAHRSRKLA